MQKMTRARYILRHASKFVFFTLRSLRLCGKKILNRKRRKVRKESQREKGTCLTCYGTSSSLCDDFQHKGDFASCAHHLHFNNGTPFVAVDLLNLTLQTNERTARHSHCIAINKTR